MTKTLQDRFQEDLKESMRNKDSTRLSVIRYLRSHIHNLEIERQTDLDDHSIIQLLNKQAKQRKDSIDAFQKGNRQDLVDKEKAELEIIYEYLPKQLSQNELIEIAKNSIELLKAKGPEDMGKVMGHVMGLPKGMAQGGEVSQIVKDLLLASPE